MNLVQLFRDGNLYCLERSQLRHAYNFMLHKLEYHFAGIEEDLCGGPEVPHTKKLRRFDGESMVASGG